MLTSTRSAAVLLGLMALLPLAWQPVEQGSPCAQLAPISSHCCCGPTHAADDDCGCTARSGDATPGSPAVPVPAPQRTALAGPGQVVVAVLAESSDPGDALTATFATRARGEPPPLLAHCVRTL